MLRLKVDDDTPTVILIDGNYRCEAAKFHKYDYIPAVIQYKGVCVGEFDCDCGIKGSKCEKIIKRVLTHENGFYDVDVN